MLRVVLFAVAFTGVPAPLRRPAVGVPRMALAVEASRPANTESPVSEPPFRLREAALSRKALFASGLAFLSGMVDVATFTAAGCYACMMTGNTISLVTALTSGRLR